MNTIPNISLLPPFTNLTDTRSDPVRLKTYNPFRFLLHTHIPHLQITTARGFVPSLTRPSLCTTRVKRLETGSRTVYRVPRTALPRLLTDGPGQLGRHWDAYSSHLCIAERPIALPRLLIAAD